MRIRNCEGVVVPDVDGDQEKTALWKPISSGLSSVFVSSESAISSVGANSSRSSVYGFVSLEFTHPGSRHTLFKKSSIRSNETLPVRKAYVSSYHGYIKT